MATLRVNTMTNEANDPIVTRRANECYIYTGPRSLITPATLEQLHTVIIAMKRVQHVNRAIIEGELRDRLTRPSRWPMTRIELMCLQDLGMYESPENFLRLYGVSRQFSYDRAVRDQYTLPEHEEPDACHYCGKSMVGEAAGASACASCVMREVGALPAEGHTS